MQYKVGTNLAVNVMHFQQAPDFPFDDINLGALAERVENAWTTGIRTRQTPQTVLEKIVAIDLGNVPGVRAERGVGLPGTGLAAPSPNNVTTVMTLRTSVGGRSGRGRIYHVGIPNNHYIGDILNATDRAGLVTAYDALKTLAPSGASPEFQLVVVSRYANLAQRATGIKNRVTSITNDGIMDSQRRRLTGRGR
jgi:hypothetical protein